MKKLFLNPVRVDGARSANGDLSTPSSLISYAGQVGSSARPPKPLGEGWVYRGERRNKRDLMKKFLSLFFIINLIHICAISSFNAPDLGRTHFIVGMPVDEKKIEQAVICQADDLSALLRCMDGSYKQAFFSPDDDLEALLIQLINVEKLSIKAAVFSFTNGDIAQALINAHRRGIEIEIVTDISCVRDKFNKIELLKKSGIKIFVYNPRNSSIFNNIMHNKFVLFGKNIGGKSLLWTGSFNFTKSAKMYNQENIIVVDEIHLIERYRKQFAILKQRLKGKDSLKLAQKKNKTILARGKRGNKKHMIV
jgi:mitochondrial cardiolipin hydrolase